MKTRRTAKPRAGASLAGQKGRAASLPRLLLLVLLAALLLRSFIVAPFSIPSESMLPRMLIGDFLFVAKWPYGFSRHALPFEIAGLDGRLFAGEPERGDVVIFRYPGAAEEDYVKRLIGLPGDTVAIESGTLILNGSPVERIRVADFALGLAPNAPCRRSGSVALIAPDDDPPFCRYPRYRETLPGGRSYMVVDRGDFAQTDDMAATTVPDGHYFLLGDNRDDSADSRFTLNEGGVGMVPAENLIGRALVTFFSVDGTAVLDDPASWLPAVRWNRIGKGY